jgi:PAS domain S-box-containing protein
MRSSEIPSLHAALDEAIATSVVRYQRARERRLQALDRISTAALGEPGAYEALLHSILVALAERTASVDSVVLLLRQEDKLRVAAVVGLPEEGLLGREVDAGKGHAGRVLTLARAVLVRDASTDPNIELDALRESRTHAVFAVPLQLEGEMVGVAMMGSRTSYEFSREDELLLRAMANRASALIAQARLRRQLEVRAAELEDVIRTRQKAQDELRAREEQLRMAVAATGLGLFDWNLNTRSVVLSDRMRRLLGLTPEEPLTWERFLELIEPQQFDRMQQALQGVWHSGVNEQRDAEFRTRDGRWISARGSMQVDSSGARRFIGTAIDTTERKQHEAALERAAEFQKRIVGIVSHDLRNPLNVIQLSATLLARGKLSEAQRAALGRLLSSTRRAGRLIRDLLDYTSASIGGGIQIRPRPTDLSRLAARGVDEARLQDEGRDIQLVVSGQATGAWDPDRLAQVVTNLLDNALQHSPKGTPVRVLVQGTADTGTLIVSNAGPAIPPEVLPTLFEPFRRGPGGERTRGLGLGLYISRQIVSAHGGTIEGRSSAGQGTSFTVTLPRKRRST